MNAVAQWAAYASLIIFLVAIGVRFMRIRHYPVNMRWEIYPIPHEGAKRAAYGGSKMEESDHWLKQHKPSRVTELKFMLLEMVFIKGLFDHNRKLWWRSFPFHFGLYMLAGFIGLLGLGAIMQLLGVWSLSLGAYQAVAVLAKIVGVAGMILSLLGASGLLYLRLTDDELKQYTNGSHYFNLVVIMLVEALGLVMWKTADPDFSHCRHFIAGLLTFELSSYTGSALVSFTIFSASLLIAYIPLTHMSHFFVKWFTWHKLRWDDSANVRGGRIEKMIQEALSYPVSWQAPHIGGDGKKTWADVATEEMNK